VIVHKAVDQGLRWYFAIAMSVIMMCLGLMGFLHWSLDKPGTGIIPRWCRLSLRIVLGILFAASPLFHNNSSVLELEIYCGGLGGVVLLETIGKIGTIGNMAESPSDPITPRDCPHPCHESIMTSGDVEYRSGEKSFRGDDLTACETGRDGIGSVGMMRTLVVRRGQRGSQLIQLPG